MKGIRKMIDGQPIEIKREYLQQVMTPTKPPRAWLDYLEWRVKRHKDDFENHKTKETYELWRVWDDVYRKALEDDFVEEVHKPGEVFFIPDGENPAEYVAKMRGKDKGLWTISGSGEKRGLRIIVTGDQGAGKSVFIKFLRKAIKGTDFEHKLFIEERQL